MKVAAIIQSFQLDEVVISFDITPYAFPLVFCPLACHLVTELPEVSFC